MPQVNRDAIRAFLRESGTPDDIADDAMRAAEELFAVLDTSRRSPDDPVDPSRLAAVVSSVTGRPVERSMCLSRRYLISKEPWMTPEAYERHREIELRNAGAVILEESVSPTFREALESAQSEPLERALRAVARERDLALRWGTIDFDAQERAAALAVPQGFSWRSICLEKLKARMALTDVLSSVMDEDDGMHVRIALEHLFAYAIAGNRERVELFASLVPHLTPYRSTFIPIGWKKHEPTTLLVNVA